MVVVVGEGSQVVSKHGHNSGNGGHAEKEEEFSELWSNFWERLSRRSVAGLGIVKTKWEETVKLKE